MNKFKPSFLFASLTLAAFFLVNFTVIYFTGPYGWDDGAITLAFSKTLAETGNFSLTPVSETVEGTSSLLFTLLMASLHFIFEFEFISFILASQIVSYLFLLGTVTAIYLAINSPRKDLSISFSILGIFFLLPMFTKEIQNGMEMTLFSFLLTLYYIKFYKNINWIIALTPLILLTRFEAIFYLGFSIMFLFLFASQKKHLLFIGLYTLCIFMLITMVRWNYFGEILPNTILAKMNPPYTSDVLIISLLKKIAGGFEFMKVAAMLLLSLIIIIYFTPKNWIRNDLGVYLILSFAIFSLIIGKNVGYDGRMFLAILPIIILVTFRMASKMRVQEFQLVIHPRKKAIPLSKNLILSSIVFTSVVFTHILNMSLHKDNFTTSIRGAYYQNLLPDKLKFLIARRIDSFGGLGITPENYRLTGETVDKIRIILEQNTISLMVPDVGGLGLCCSQIQVIDSALLTNKELTKLGYDGFHDHLHNTLPDIIETHGFWSKVTRIYDSNIFNLYYLPIVFENNLFWLRNDLYPNLIGSPLLSKKIIDKRLELKGIRYAEYDIDQEYLNSLQLNNLPAFNLL